MSADRTCFLASGAYQSGVILTLRSLRNCVEPPLVLVIVMRAIAMILVHTVNETAPGKKQLAFSSSYILATRNHRIAELTWLCALYLVVGPFDSGIDDVDTLVSAVEVSEFLQRLRSNLPVSSLLFYQRRCELVAGGTS